MQAPSLTVQFGELRGYLVHHHILDLVGYEVNRNRKTVRNFPFKIRHTHRETGVPRPQARVVVAPKGPSYLLTHWKAP